MGKIPGLWWGQGGPPGHEAPLGVKEGHLVPHTPASSTVSVKGVPWSDGPRICDPRNEVLSTCESPADIAPLSSPTSPQSEQTHCSLLCPEHPARLPRILGVGDWEQNKVVCPSHSPASPASQTGLKRTHGQFFLHIFIQPVPSCPLPLSTLPLDSCCSPPTPKAFRDGTQHPSWDPQLGTRLQ